jgi:hypothetical protein
MELNNYIDHTNLKQIGTLKDIETLCNEAINYHFASVCVAPYYVPLAKKLLKDSTVAVCTVIGFPNGYSTKEVKVFEAINAIENGADFIFQTDSDGQTNPDEFAGFLEDSKNYDCVMGNRVVRGDGKDRKMVENVLRCFCWFFFGSMVPDANAPFRLMKASVVEKYLPVMPEDFNLPNAVLAACFKRFNEKVTYRVISFRPRQGGVNSINMKKIFKIGWKAIGDFKKINANLKHCNLR